MDQSKGTDQEPRHSSPDEQPTGVLTDLVRAAFKAGDVAALVGIRSIDNPFADTARRSAWTAGWHGQPWTGVVELLVPGGRHHAGEVA